MSGIGILAYGSIVNDPGPEIAASIVRRIPVSTPFPVEYARLSKKRGYGPTVVPHANGAPVRAVVLVLSDAVPLGAAKDMLWRREVGKVGSGEPYPAKSTKNAVVVQEERGFRGLECVVYTDFHPEGKLPAPDPEALARAAVESRRTKPDGENGVGYRTNHEVAATVDLTPAGGDKSIVEQALEFLASLLRFVPGQSERTPAVQRAMAFLSTVEKQIVRWAPARRRDAVRQHLVFTLPGSKTNDEGVGALEEAFRLCRARGGSPDRVRVASPFFDNDAETSQVAAALCKAMARSGRRRVTFAVPAVHDEASAVLRLAAPRSLLSTPERYDAKVVIETLPDTDADSNGRIWHAKMLMAEAGDYSALMVGSSNFTSAGMGTTKRRNVEANLLTIVDRVAFARETKQLEAVWPETGEVEDPQAAEWLGAEAKPEEEEQAVARPVPPGFLDAVYRAGSPRSLVILVEPEKLPGEWSLSATGRDAQDLLTADSWRAKKSPASIEIPWIPVQPPEKLLVRWDGHEGFLPLNVEDQRELPPPAQLEGMKADDMLAILAASDPGAAFRAWARRQQRSELFDDDIDSAVPIDLDPLRLYDLHQTFLHRVRRRARVLAQLRANLQRPAPGRQALEWRLRGLVGIEALAERLAREVTNDSASADEGLLTLADFLIVLREVDYEAADGALSKKDFDGVFRPFLRDLSDTLHAEIGSRRDSVSADTFRFWARVVEQCHE